MVLGVSGGGVVRVMSFRLALLRLAGISWSLIQMHKDKDCVTEADIEK